MFVCIEGVDAAGKATQSKMLAEKMGAKLLSFPDYSTPIGHIIEGHLKRYWEATPIPESQARLTSSVDCLNAYVFQALQFTNRLERYGEIYELLDDDVHIVADRYWPSGWVYGQLDGLDPEWLMRVQETGPGPDLHLLLDIDPAQSSVRRPERRDRYERQAGLMGQAATLYRQLWCEQGVEDDSWVTIDGNGTIEEVHLQVVAAVEAHANLVIYPEIKLPWRT